MHLYSFKYFIYREFKIKTKNFKTQYIYILHRMRLTNKEYKLKLPFIFK